MRLTDKHAIHEALRAGRAFTQVTFYVNPKRDARLGEIERRARKAGVPVTMGDARQRGRGQQRVESAVEAECSDFVYAPLEEVIDRARATGAAAQILALDHVEDPRNLGAVIRSAAAAGAAGVIIEKRRCSPVTAIAYETSSGGAERVSVAMVSNLRAALEALKKNDFWIAGADERAETAVHDTDLAVPLVWVLGAEGSGLSRLIRETCDFLVRIPTNPVFPSLNVSVAAGVLLFEAARQKREKEKEKINTNLHE